MWWHFYHFIIYHQWSLWTSLCVSSVALLTFDNTSLNRAKRRDETTFSKLHFIFAKAGFENESKIFEWVNNRKDLRILTNFFSSWEISHQTVQSSNFHTGSLQAQVSHSKYHNNWDRCAGAITFFLNILGFRLLDCCLLNIKLSNSGDQSEVSAPKHLS